MVTAAQSRNTNTVCCVTDSLDGWLTYDENFPETALNAYVSPIADGSDPNYTGHMKGEVVTDGVEFTFTDTFYGINTSDECLWFICTPVQ